MRLLGDAAQVLATKEHLYGQMYKLAVVPFDCLLVLQDTGQETRRRHSFKTEIAPGTNIHVDGRDWAVVEIYHRRDDVPAVVCRRT
jgi:hypothetical protein